MPVHRRAVVVIAVSDVDDNLIAPAGFDDWAGVCAVECDAADLRLAVGRELLALLSHEVSCVNQGWLTLGVGSTVT